MRYYISDLHFYHESLLTKMDCRGFENCDKMHQYMIERWNKKVRENDEVVILGDVSMERGKKTNDILQQLNEKNKHAFESCYIGKSVEVLFEEAVEKDGISCWQGHTREYLKVTVPNDGRDLHNKICDCILQESDVE